MSWGVAAGNAALVVRVFLAAPVRAVAWVFVGLSLVASGMARCLAWMADLVEGS